MFQKGVSGAHPIPTQSGGSGKELPGSLRAGHVVPGIGDQVAVTRTTDASQRSQLEPLGVGLGAARHDHVPGAGLPPCAGALLRLPSGFWVSGTVTLSVGPFAPPASLLPACSEGREDRACVCLKEAVSCKGLQPPGLGALPVDKLRRPACHQLRGVDWQHLEASSWAGKPPVSHRSSGRAEGAAGRERKPGAGTDCRGVTVHRASPQHRPRAAWPSLRCAGGAVSLPPVTPDLHRLRKKTGVRSEL